jgi:hypothetical protein
MGKTTYVIDATEPREIKILAPDKVISYIPTETEELITSAASIEAVYTAEEISGMYLQLAEVVEGLPKMAKRPKPKKPAAALLFKAIEQYMEIKDELDKAEAAAAKGDKGKTKKERKPGNVAKVHEICDKLKGGKKNFLPSSKEVIAAAEKQGIPVATARTQYYAWRKLNK